MQKLENNEKELKKNESALNKNLKESRDMQENLRTLEKAFPFINDEKDFFGFILKLFEILLNIKFLKRGAR